jgi:hypothetical protein
MIGCRLSRSSIRTCLLTIAGMLLPILLLTAVAFGAQANDRLRTAKIMTISDLPEPEYLGQVTDPAFGTLFTRVTYPGRMLFDRVSCEPTHCRHRYSSAQAWNADQSLLLISKGCNGFCFLDGQTYKPAFHRRASGECEWHPTDPTQMICVEDQRIYAWAVREDVKTTLYAPGDYKKLKFGPSKGNLSNDGSRLVVQAVNGDGETVSFAYDIGAARKFPDISLARLVGENSFCSISPSGHYILCVQRLPDGANPAYVFAVDGVLIQTWPENHRPGHGDMALDSDGKDVYVGISKADPDKYHIIKRRLDDGFVTSIAPFGRAQHVSARNIRKPGWVFVTFGGEYSQVVGGKETTPFYQEIVAMRIDGSGEIRRVAHTRSSNHDYLSEAQASPSPDGSQVIWSSNWGRAGDPVAAYIAQLEW